MVNTLDIRLSRLCNRLKAVAQQSQDTITDILEELVWMLDSNPGREDISAFAEDIKKTIKADGSDHWKLADKWSSHFDGITVKKKD